jgi:hypothetical protein
MKLHMIFEMAKPAATCPKCGRGPMSKTHYWYKGAWKCKAAGDQPTEPVSQAAAPKPAAVAPPPSNAAILADVKQMLPRQNEDSPLYWQATEWNGTITVRYEYTFRRSTALGAYMDNRRMFDQANATLRQIAAKYPDIVQSQRYVDRDSINRDMERAESNGDSPYSEHEQSIGGSVTLKAA